MKIRLVAGPAIALVVLCCREASTPPDTTPKSITLSAAATSIVAGTSTQLTAVVKDGDGNEVEGLSVAFASNDVVIITTSDAGLATAVGKAGSTTVKATLGTLTSNSVTIAVTPGAAATVAKEGTAPTTLFAGLAYNDSIRVTVRDAYGNANAGVAVAFAVTAGGGSVSPASVVTNAGGMAAARFLTGPDAAANTVTATVTGLTAASFSVTTIEPVASVALSVAPDSVLTRDSMPATATAKDKNGVTLNGRAVTWTSTAPLIATVSSAGGIKGIAPGNAYVKATVEGKADSALVRVYTPPISTLSVDVPSDLILAGVTTEVATYVGRAARGDTITHKPVTWTSSTPGVATIDATGRITTIAAGTTTLTATVEGKNATRVITVEPRSRYENPRCVMCIFRPHLNPRDPAFDQAKKGSIPNPNDTRQQITIDETFSVPAGQQVVWDNLIVWVKPKTTADIIVRGTLTVKNSAVFWDQTSPQQTSLEVLSGGTLRIFNSTILQANLLLYNLNYRDGSTVEFNHFISDAWTALEGAVKYTAVNATTVHLTPLINTRNSTITIRDAMSLSLELYTPPGTYEITFPKKYIYTDWVINSMWPGTTLSATNSYMTHLSAVALVPGAHVTVKDAEDFILSWAINKFTPGMAVCELRDLGDPATSTTYYADKTWALPCVNSTLTLKNVQFVNVGLYTGGNIQLKVYDSNLADPHVYSGPGMIEIYNSTLTHVFALNTGRVYLENVKVRLQVVSSGNGSLMYGYNVTSALATPFQTFQVDGGKYFVLTSPGAPWNK